MDIQLGSVGVRLRTPDRPIAQGWRALFAEWAGTLPAGPAMTLDFSLAGALAPPPPVPFIFQHPLTKMVVYRLGDMWQLRFPGRAVIHCPAVGTNQPAPVTGRVKAAAAETTALEDITFTALAPWLRRHGWYLVHAFAVAHNGRACLLVGPSHSGKTTAGLRLVLAGRHLLGNDLVLLQNRPEGVCALPTPGQVRIRPGTLSLLPELQPAIDHQLPDGSAILNRALLSPPADSRPVRITRIFFPQVEPAGWTELKPLSQGVTFARLAEESLDRWDTATFAGHLDCLQNLSAQVESAGLILGRDAGAIIPQLQID